MNDAGADLDNYFSLDFQIKIPKKQTENIHLNNITILDSNISIRIFDEMIAVCYLDLSIEVGELSFINSKNRSDFDYNFVKFVENAIQDSLQLIDNFINTEKNKLINIISQLQNKNLMFPDGLTTPKIGWVHKVFINDGEDFENEIINSPTGKNIIATTTLDKFTNNKDYYGWGGQYQNKRSR